MKKFTSGDLVKDKYGQKGIVIGETDRQNALLLLVKKGDVLYTLEASENRWEFIKNYPEFDDMLENLI